MYAYTGDYQVRSVFRAHSQVNRRFNDIDDAFRYKQALRDVYDVPSVVRLGVTDGSASPDIIKSGG